MKQQLPLLLRVTRPNLYPSPLTISSSRRVWPCFYEHRSSCSRRREPCLHCTSKGKTSDGAGAATGQAEQRRHSTQEAGSNDRLHNTGGRNAEAKARTHGRQHVQARWNAPKTSGPQARERPTSLERGSPVGRARRASGRSQTWTPEKKVACIHSRLSAAPARLTRSRLAHRSSRRPSCPAKSLSLRLRRSKRKERDSQRSKVERESKSLARGWRCWLQRLLYSTASSVALGSDLLCACKLHSTAASSRMPSGLSSDEQDVPLAMQHTLLRPSI